MQNLLQYAYVEKRCNQCGGSYHITLYEMLMEHRANDEGPAARGCSVCSLEARQVMWTIPAGLLEELETAWEAVRAAAEEAHAGLKLGT